MSKTDQRENRSSDNIPTEIVEAATAAADKKAFDLVALDLREASAFTDYFLICSGQNTRQVKTIADAIQETLAKRRSKPAHVEGYEHAEWILIDYFNFVVHIFTSETRAFYALERLWGIAEPLTMPVVEPASREPRS